MDERGVGDSDFCTRRILEALEKQTNKLLETQEERFQRKDAESSEHICVPHVINEEVVEEEEEGRDGGDEEADKDSEAIKAEKQQKRNYKTKDLV